MLDDPECSPDVSLRDLILYLRVFRHSLVPPVEMPAIIWGLMPSPQWKCTPIQVITPAVAAQTWCELDLDRRVKSLARLSEIGLSPDSIIRLIGPKDRHLVRGASSVPARRGRPTKGRQLFRTPASAAHANAFIDALRFQFYRDELRASDVMTGFYIAYRAYRAVVDIETAKLSVEDAWAVTLSAIAGELASQPCYLSRCYYYVHADHDVTSPPWLTHGMRSLTMADRVRCYLLYYTPREEHPVFSASDFMCASRSMREGSARWATHAAFPDTAPRPAPGSHGQSPVI